MIAISFELLKMHLEHALQSPCIFPNAPSHHQASARRSLPRTHNSLTQPQTSSPILPTKPNPTQLTNPSTRTPFAPFRTPSQNTGPTPPSNPTSALSPNPTNPPKLRSSSTSPPSPNPTPRTPRSRSYKATSGARATSPGRSARLCSAMWCPS